MENLSLDEQIRKNEKLKKIEEAKFASSISESEQKLINAVHEKKSKEEILKLEEDIAAVIKQKEESLANLKKSEKILQDQRKAADERKAEADKLEKLRLEVKADSESVANKEAEKWDKRRKDTITALTDPKAWMGSFLKKQALDVLESAISKKKRMGDAKKEEEKVEKKKKSDNEMLARENEYRNAIMDRNEIQADPENEILKYEVIDEIRVSLGSDDKVDTLINSVDQSNQTQSKQLRQDSDQWKADQRTSASEEAGAGISGGGDTPSIGSVEKPEKPKKKGVMGGLGGIIGNIMKKFGKAGKFLMSLGSRFLMPLLTTPVGWGILAGLAVGGLVFAYWDDIMAVVGKIFDKVKGFFSSVGNSISKGISAIGDAISSIIDFFNPLNLIPMIARALLPTKMYDAISGFFGGDSTQEREDKVSRDSAKSDMEDKDIELENAEIDLDDAITREQKVFKSVDKVKTATAIGITPKGGHMILQIIDNGRHNVPAAHAEIRKAGARVATPEEIQSILAPLESNLAVANLDIDKKSIVHHDAAVAQSKAHGKFKEADKKVKASEEEKEKTPHDIIRKLESDGAVKWNTLGNSAILNWEPIKSMDKDTIKKLMDFDDWDDQQTSDLVSLWNTKDLAPKLETQPVKEYKKGEEWKAHYKKPTGVKAGKSRYENSAISKAKMDYNNSLKKNVEDIPLVKPNEQNQKRKSDVMNQALQQGMDNRISGTQGQNGGSSGSQTNISAPTVNNNTTIKKEATHDTDVTARGLNKSAMMSLDDEF